MKGYQPGDTISGKYLLIESVGGGAMGEVFKAEHILMHKTVAVKILHQNVQDNSEIVERFKREAQAAAAIEHSNVCNVTDFALTENNEFYLVMEYLEGDTLQKRIREKGALSAEETIFIMQQLLSVLQCAHELGIVHRDVKPENIALIHKEETDDFVKLLDFGIAHQDSVCHHLEDGEEKFKTQAGFVYGTPEYISPEQANGQAVDARTDLYACGIILYEMLTGEVPFKSDSLIGLLQQQVFDAPPHLDFNKVEHGAEFDAIIQKLLSKKREDRYASAREVIYALDDISLTANEDSIANQSVSSDDNKQAEFSPSDVIKDIGNKCVEKGQLVFNQFASTSCGAIVVEKISKVSKKTGIIIGCCFIGVLIIICCIVSAGSRNEVDVQNLDWDELPKLRSVSDVRSFVYDEEFSVDNDKTLSKDENLIKACKAFQLSDYKTCYDNVVAVDGRYREHPNYLRLRISAAYALAKTNAIKKDSERYEKLMESILTDFIDLSAEVPDAARVESIHKAVGLVFTDSRKYKASKALARIANLEEEIKKTNKLQLGPSKAEKFAAGLAWAIVYLPYDQDEERKRNMFKAYESLPQSNAVPQWQKLALDAWKLGKDECKKRSNYIKTAFQEDSQEELYYGLLIPLYNNLRLDIQDKYKRYQCRSNIFKAVDCNYCIKSNIISGYESWSVLADDDDLRSAKTPFIEESKGTNDSGNEDQD